MWFLPGLPERRIGTFVRMHHVIADGIAGVATIGNVPRRRPRHGRRAGAVDTGTGADGR
jgi:hypothetical protein